MIENFVGLLSGFWYYIIVFLIVLTIVVFVHELGHYLVARWNGVRVETFSIGFGREIWGMTARSGTRWRISLLPFGGYVKMFGENEFDEGEHKDLSPAEKAVSFHHKSVWRRAAIVAAGPFANLLFGVVLLAGMFLAYGQLVTPPVVGGVIPDSAAAEAGLREGDRIVRVSGEEVQTFQDIQQIVRLRMEEKLVLDIERDGRLLNVTVRPRIRELTDAFGNSYKVPMIGIQSPTGASQIVEHGPVSATVAAVRETGNLISGTFTAVGQMISGDRDSQELGGPLRIAKGAGQAAQMGVDSVLFFIILLSVNLGLINLFPIPLLDGGHLAFYAIEAVRGKPLSLRAQEYGFRIGLFLVFALMLFATRNDLVDLKVWDFFKGLIS